jgi:hypothetical protein
MPALEDKNRTRLERLAVGTLLRAQDKSEKIIRDVAHPFFAQAAHEYGGLQKTRRKELASVLVFTGDQMAKGLERAIVEARKQVRAMSLVRLGDELKSKWLELPAGKLGASGAARIEADVAHATMAADSLVSQWRGQVFTRVRMAERKGASVHVAFQQAEKAFEFRIRRTAVGETSHAYMSEHRGAVRDAAKRGDLPNDLKREWSAFADACRDCLPHHGERVGIDEDYEDGDEPGDVHRNCNCVEYIC